MKIKELNIEIPDGCEIDIEKSTFVFKEKEVKSWNPEGKIIDGAYILPDSSISNVRITYKNQKDKNIFASKKEAESALAMAQISILIKYDKRYGGVITDKEWDIQNTKRAIVRNGSKIEIIPVSYWFHFLAFHTREQAELFLREHEDLIKQYYMLN